MLPIYLLMILTFYVFAIEVDEVADRLSAIITLFLASFAMLYVVEQHLPRMNFLTAIDKLIVMTTVLMVIVGCVVVLLLRISAQSGEKVANQWNEVAVIALSSCYVVGNLVLLVPPCWRMRQKLHNLRAQARTDAQVSPAGGAGNLYASLVSDSTSRHMVFMPLADIPRS